MKILCVHNAYGRHSGEETVVESLQQLLVSRGHELTSFARSSVELEGQPLGKIKAFFTGIYNWSSQRQMRRMLAEHRPDLVHIHNLFPLISPSVLGECRRAGVPVVMTVHNYRLVCPTGLHMLHGKVCQDCVGGREYMCVVHRCEGGLGKSLGYALRAWVARKMRFYFDNVTMYAALTEFQRARLITAGFPTERIAVVPNMASTHGVPATAELGNYVGYVGRISFEKGIPSLLAAARACPDVPFKAAGSYERMSHLREQAPANFEFLDHIDPAQLGDFYAQARIIVLCSTCFEGFPTVLLEAMLHRKPVICSRIGGLPEIVDEGKTGLLFQPGDSTDLAQKIRYLWDRPDICRQMGQTGQEKAAQNYSPEQYYAKLMAIYDKALKFGSGGAPVR